MRPRGGEHALVAGCRRPPEVAEWGGSGSGGGLRARTDREDRGPTAQSDASLRRTREAAVRTEVRPHSRTLRSDAQGKRQCCRRPRQVEPSRSILETAVSLAKYADAHFASAARGGHALRARRVRDGAPRRRARASRAAPGRRDGGHLAAYGARAPPYDHTGSPHKSTDHTRGGARGQAAWPIVLGASVP